MGKAKQKQKNETGVVWCITQLDLCQGQYLVLLACVQ